MSERTSGARTAARPEVSAAARPEAPAPRPVLGIVLLAAAALLAIGAATFAGPCPTHDDGSLPGCAQAGQYVLYLGIVGAIAALARVLVNRAPVRAIGSLAAAACGAAAALLPGTVLPLCMMATMRCHTIMRPFALIVGIAIAVLGVADALVSRKDA